MITLMTYKIHFCTPNSIISSVDMQKDISVHMYYLDYDKNIIHFQDSHDFTWLSTASYFFLAFTSSNFTHTAQSSKNSFTSYRGL